MDSAVRGDAPGMPGFVEKSRPAACLVRSRVQWVFDGLMWLATELVAVSECASLLLAVPSPNSAS